MWALANTFVKFSILHLYVCLFPLPRFHLAAYITMALTTVYIVFIIISSFTICYPFSYFWDRSQKGHCRNQIALYTADAIFNLILDVIVVLLPMPMLWGLQMAREESGIDWTRRWVCTAHAKLSLGCGFQPFLILSPLKNRICLVSILRINIYTKSTCIISHTASRPRGSSHSWGQTLVSSALAFQSSGPS